MGAALNMGRFISCTTVLLAIALFVSTHAESHPDIEFVDATSFQEAYAGANNAQTLKNVRALKAYCNAAYEKAFDMKKSRISYSKNALVELIVKYGKPEKKKSNIVTKYAEITGKLKAKYRRGVGHYMLKHLDKAVVFGRGVVSVSKNVRRAFKARFSSKSMGFDAPPAYFRKMSVSLSEYTAKKTKIDAETSDADSEAAADWLLKGTKKKYKSFLGRIKSKVKAKSERLWKKVVAGAFAEIKSTWKKDKRIHPEPPAGILGADKVFHRLEKKLKLPSKAEMRAAAKALAMRWRRANKSRSEDDKSVIRSLEKKEQKKVVKKAEKKAAKKAAKKEAKKKAAKKEAKKEASKKAAPKKAAPKKAASKKLRL